MKILDREARGGEEGEIVVKGPQVMRGYVDSSLDADAFTADGFLRTGDLGRFDEHGAILITGRVKDIIIRKGENVSAKEVEDVLYAHPKVADVAVLGIPDADRGEMVVAFVVPKDPADAAEPQDVREHCKERRADDAEDPRAHRDHRRDAAQPERQGAQARAARPDQPPARLTSASKRRCCAGSSAAVSSGCHCTARRQRAVELERLDDAVVGAADDAQAVAELVDRLMVMAGDAGRLRAHHLGEQRARVERDLVRAPPAHAGLAVRRDAGILGDVLVQRAAAARR